MDHIILKKNESCTRKWCPNVLYILARDHFCLWKDASCELGRFSFYIIIIEQTICGSCVVLGKGLCLEVASSNLIWRANSFSRGRGHKDHYESKDLHCFKEISKLAVKSNSLTDVVHNANLIFYSGKKVYCVSLSCMKHQRWVISFERGVGLAFPPLFIPFLIHRRF